MPVWCHNTMYVMGDPQDIAAFREKAQGDSPWEDEEGQTTALTFNSLLPIPIELLEPANAKPDCPSQRTKCEPMDGAYAHGGLSKWAGKYWGTDSDARRVTLNSDCDLRLIYDFETAEGPPGLFLKQVSKAWPMLRFILEYKESVDCSIGLAEAENGSVDSLCLSTL